MMRFMGVIFGVAVLVGHAWAQDPQAMLNGLIRQHTEQQGLRQQNQMMRLELERIDLQRQLWFRRATDSQVNDELLRFCPNGSASCRAQPPADLIAEASKRGLIEPVPSARPSVECQTFGDEMGGGITRCY